MFSRAAMEAARVARSVPLVRIETSDGCLLSVCKEARERDQEGGNASGLVDLGALERDRGSSWDLDVTARASGAALALPLVERLGVAEQEIATRPSTGPKNAVPHPRPLGTQSDTFFKPAQRLRPSFSNVTHKRSLGFSMHRVCGDCDSPMWACLYSSCWVHWKEHRFGIRAYLLRKRKDVPGCCFGCVGIENSATDLVYPVPPCVVVQRQAAQEILPWRAVLAS